MGLFDKFFKKIKVKWSSFFGYQNTSAPFDKEAWYHDTFRATVDAIATHASKGQFKAVKLNQFGKVEKTFENDKMVRLLNILALCRKKSMTLLVLQLVLLIRRTSLPERM